MKQERPEVVNQRYFGRFPTPSVAILELTNRCNHACVHCVRESPSYYAPDAMTDKDWFQVIDDLAAINTFGICFTGGEATTHPMLLPFIERARSHRMGISLKSNGMLLSRLATSLQAVGVQHMEISLYGATAETHERCTGVKGSFDLTVAGIRAVKAVGLPVSLSISLFRWNVHEIDEVRALAASLDCSIQRDYFLMNTDLGHQLDEHFLSAEQIRWVESKWPGFTLPAAQNGYKGIKICAQGANVIGVTARGDILSCITIRKPIGHVHEKGIVETWREQTGGDSGRPKRAHSIDYSKFHRCNNCEHVSRCNTCLGQTYAATGDFYEPPLERCFVTMALYGNNIGNKEGDSDAVLS